MNKEENFFKVDDTNDAYTNIIHAILNNELNWRDLNKRINTKIEEEMEIEYHKLSKKINSWKQITEEEKKRYQSVSQSLINYYENSIMFFISQWTLTNKSNKKELINTCYKYWLIAEWLDYSDKFLNSIWKQMFKSFEEKTIQEQNKKKNFGFWKVLAKTAIWVMVACSVLMPSLQQVSAANFWSHTQEVQATFRVNDQKVTQFQNLLQYQVFKNYFNNWRLIQSKTSQYKKDLKSLKSALEDIYNSKKQSAQSRLNAKIMIWLIEDMLDEVENWTSNSNTTTNSNVQDKINKQKEEAIKNSRTDTNVSWNSNSNYVNDKVNNWFNSVDDFEIDWWDWSSSNNNNNNQTTNNTTYDNYVKSINNNYNSTDAQYLIRQLKIFADWYQYDKWYSQKEAQNKAVQDFKIFESYVKKWNVEWTLKWIVKLFNDYNVWRNTKRWGSAFETWYNKQWPCAWTNTIAYIMLIMWWTNSKNLRSHVYSSEDHVRIAIDWYSKEFDSKWATTSNIWKRVWWNSNDTTDRSSSSSNYNFDDSWDTIYW